MPQTLAVGRGGLNCARDLTGVHVSSGLETTFVD